MYTLIHRAGTTLDQEHLEKELGSLRQTLQLNRHNQKDISTVLPDGRGGGEKLRDKEEDLTRGVTVLLYCSMVATQCERLLKKVVIKTVLRPFKKMGQCIHPMKDCLGFRVPCVYEIPGSCGLTYIG